MALSWQKPALVCLLSLLAACNQRVPSEQLPDFQPVHTAGFLPAVRQQLDALADKARKRPRNARAAGHLGMACLAYGQDEAAVAALARAHALDPGEYRWRYLYAEALSRTGDFDLAVQLLEHIVAARPDDMAARTRLGTALARLGETTRAVEQLAAVVSAAPDQPQARLAYAQALIDAGDPRTAIEQLQAWLDGHGHAGRVHFVLAGAWRRLGDEAAAARHLALFERYRHVGVPSTDALMNEVRQLDRSEKPLLRRAESLAASGRTEEAIETLHAALERNPDSVLTHATLVGAYGALKQFEQADRHYRLALERGPATAALLRNLGRARAYEKRLTEARQAFEQAREMNPHDAKTVAWLGWLAQQRRDAAAAEALFDEALRLDPDERVARLELGKLLKAQDRHEESLVHFEWLLEPESALTTRALVYLAEALVGLGRIDEAQQQLQRAAVIAQSRGDRRELARVRGLSRRLQ